MEKIIINYKEEKIMILYSFVGTGTTTIACQLTLRRYVGFEIKKEYNNIGKTRISSYPKKLEDFL